jgi:hypothetical protein
LQLFLGSGSEGATLAVRAGSMAGLESGFCEMLSLSMVPELLEEESNRSVVEVGLLVCPEEVVLLSAELAEVPDDPPTSEPPPHAQIKNRKQTQLVL